MFGMGMTELLIIFAVALIVIGPKKLPDLAKSLGKALNEFKSATQDFKDSLDTEVNQINKTYKDNEIDQIEKRYKEKADSEEKKEPSNNDTETDQNKPEAEKSETDTSEADEDDQNRKPANKSSDS